MKSIMDIIQGFFPWGANYDTTPQWLVDSGCKIEEEVARDSGYNLMGGSCLGSQYPAALRDPLPGNDHHPNVTFRVALYLK